MKKRVLGLDIGRNFAIGFLLTEYDGQTAPINLFNELKKTNCHRFDNNNEGVKKLKELEIEMIILEPTGYWYSQFWVDQGKKLGIEIQWVSHQSVKWHRFHYKFKNKDDDSDAFTIAMMFFARTGYDEHDRPPLLLRYDHDTINKIRELFYEREQMVKERNGSINQLRQRLEREMPEIAKRDFKSVGKDGVNPTLGHIIGKTVNRRFPKVTTGIGISEYSREIVEDILRDTERAEKRDKKLGILLKKEEFTSYKEVFDLFEFGTVIQALMMLHCYPFDRFMINGKPYRKNGHDQSLRQFQHFLGLGFTYEKSGDTSARDGKMKKKWSGSEIIRSHLYAHALITICRKQRPAGTRITRLLKKAWFLDREREVTFYDSKGKKRSEMKTYPSFKSLGKDGICRLMFYETRLLYQELKKVCLTPKDEE
ncbi:MAG: transposase [Xenococcus sp. (in: cyanobacteria)]